MIDFLESDLSEFAALLPAGHFHSYSPRQIFQWIYDKCETDIEKWTNISLSQREWLKNHFRIGSLEVEEKRTDADGTGKFLFRLSDGEPAESVLIPEKDHHTFCISTQSGCPLGCLFCATGRMGFRRHLTSAEILAQVFHLKQALPDRRGKKNIVFMGMGEPLLNYQSLKRALTAIKATWGFNISPRNITVSTAGILEGIRTLEEDFPLVKIAVSLNAPDPAMRSRLMPWNDTEPILPILEYFRETKEARRHRITFEYVMLNGINDGDADAKKLAALLRGIPCKVNLIPYNPVPGIDFETPERKRVEAFQQLLMDKDYTVIVRWSKGTGIGSACGQLAGNTCGNGRFYD